MGESQQFFDEMDYLLDNISPEQPLNVRCLGYVCVHVFACLPILYVCWIAHTYVYVCMLVCFFVCMFVCLFVFLFVCLFCLFVFLYVCMYVCMYVVQSEEFFNFHYIRATLYHAVASDYATQG